MIALNVSLLIELYYNAKQLKVDENHQKYEDYKIAFIILFQTTFASYSIFYSATLKIFFE
jgi:hypothetical protein